MGPRSWKYVFWLLSCMAISHFQGCVGFLDDDWEVTVGPDEFQAPPWCVSEYPGSAFFVYRGCETEPAAEMDKALLTIKPHDLPPTTNLTLVAQSAQCWNCCILPIMNIPAQHNCTILVDSRFKVDLYVFSWNETSEETQLEWHRLNYAMAEGSSYSFYISEIGTGSGREDVIHKWNLYEASCGEDPYIPIYVALAVYFVLAVLSYLSIYMYRKGYWHMILTCCKSHYNVNSVGENEHQMKVSVIGGMGEVAVTDLGHPEVRVFNRPVTPTQPASVSPPPPPTPATKKRLRSLDTFRGLSLTVMIFVNYGGGGYWFFEHAFWNGLTVADLVFPWFVWIMGPSISLAFDKLLSRGTSKLQLAWHVIQRTLKLFAIGLILNSSDGSSAVTLTSYRMPGVLQRLAITYGVLGLLHIVCACPNDPYRNKKWACVRDILPFWPEWIVYLAFVGVQVLVSFLVPVSGCPTGYLGPGGYHDYGSHFNCTGGAAAEVDRWFFTENHIYKWPTTTSLYGTTVAYDPEGFLGTLNSFFIGFMGLQAGKILLIFPDWKARIGRWLVWATITGVIGAVLCEFSQNGGVIPVNKNLWSLSFVLILSCMAFILLGIFYLFIDVLDVWNGAPFYYPGMNSILIYVCHGVFHKYFPVSWAITSVSHATLLAMDLWGVTFWVIVSMVLFYKNIFVAV